MNWPIRLQIFAPFAVLLTIPVVTSAVSTAILSAQRSEATEVRQLARVVSSLSTADFPYTASVLERMRGLSGAEFIAVDAENRLVAGTIASEVALPGLGQVPVLLGSTTSLSQFPTATIGGQSYFLAAIETPRLDAARRLYVLSPRSTWEQLRWEAMWPPLAIGGVTLVLALVVSGWLADRFGRRIDTLRGLFRELEAGRFPRTTAPALQDELGTLIESANHLSARLEDLQGEVARSERLRILAQLAGGLAHQLRNGLTGARLAIQLHQRRCAARSNDGIASPEESLEVALAQLQLTERQVQGLLALSRAQQAPPEPGDLRSVLSEVARLVGPHVAHRQVQFELRDRLSAPYPLSNREALLGALLNLVLNALDAAGVGGRVQVLADETESAVRVVVADNGSGPPPQLRGRLFDPFVTSKPEGTGLGLVLAQQAAQEQGGRLSWTREHDETRFLLELPRTHAATGATTSDHSAAARASEAAGDGPATPSISPMRIGMDTISRETRAAPHDTAAPRP